MALPVNDPACSENLSENKDDGKQLFSGFLNCDTSDDSDIKWSKIESLHQAAIVSYTNTVIQYNVFFQKCTLHYVNNVCMMLTNNGINERKYCLCQQWVLGQMIKGKICLK